MDRRTTLERLDAVRPGSDDLALPDLKGAGEELARDASLAVDFERRQNWDRRIAVAMHDVPVPDDLRERLLSRLANAERSVPATPRRIIGRRRLIAVVAGLAASVVAGGVFWASTASATPVTVAEIRAASAELLAQRDEFVPFQGDFAPELPSGNLRQRLRFHEPAVELLEHRVAAWQFRANGRRPLNGVLAVVPIDTLATLPAARSLADREYVIDGNAVAWREGDFVYVCYVDGGIDELLRRLGSSPIA
ncbi:MAG: hypothetical protein WBC44_05015 [Planctomycetaceae bacterium]